MPTLSQMALVVLVDQLQKKAKKLGHGDVPADKILATIPAQFAKITRKEAKS